MTPGWHWLPNIVTFLRIVLIVPFAVALYDGQYMLALVLFFVAGLSDGVDGFLARHFNWFSRLGSIADPIADKALLVTAYVMLTLTGLLPLWLLVVVVVRDLLIVSGAVAFHIWIGRYDMKPSFLGKLNTFVQIIFALSVIMALAGIAMPDLVVRGGLWAVAAMAVLSGGHYIILWGLKAWRETR
ncbi:CDP-alcohol phosphatidyltransferase family protein [Marinobacteraceae bacterium S3BR75-40.1]